MTKNDSDMRGGASPPPALAVVAFVVVALAASPPAFARDRISYAGVRAGYLRVDDVDAGSLNVGVLGGVYFAPRVAVEASLDYHTPEFDDYWRATYALQASVYVYPFTAKHAFRPYGVAGAGFYWSYFEAYEDDLPEDNETDGGLHAGFGFDVLIAREINLSGTGAPGPPVVLTVDVRYLFTQDEPGSEPADGYLATVGMRFGF